MSTEFWQSAVETISVTMNENLAAALNRWRMTQNPIPSPTEAIELLLVLALTYEGVAVGDGEPRLAEPVEDPLVAKLIEIFRSATK